MFKNFKKRDARYFSDDLPRNRLESGKIQVIKCADGITRKRVAIYDEVNKELYIIGENIDYCSNNVTQLVLKQGSVECRSVADDTYFWKGVYKESPLYDVTHILGFGSWDIYEYIKETMVMVREINEREQYLRSLPRLVLKFPEGYVNRNDKEFKIIFPPSFEDEEIDEVLKQEIKPVEEKKRRTQEEIDRDVDAILGRRNARKSPIIADIDVDEDKVEEKPLETLYEDEVLLAAPVDSENVDMFVPAIEGKELDQEGPCALVEYHVMTEEEDMGYAYEDAGANGVDTAGNVQEVPQLLQRANLNFLSDGLKDFIKSFGVKRSPVIEPCDQDVVMEEKIGKVETCCFEKSPPPLFASDHVIPYCTSLDKIYQEWKGAKGIIKRRHYEYEPGVGIRLSRIYAAERALLEIDKEHYSSSPQRDILMSSVTMSECKSRMVDALEMVLLAAKAHMVTEGRTLRRILHNSLRISHQDDLDEILFITAFGVKILSDSEPGRISTIRIHSMLSSEVDDAILDSLDGIQRARKGETADIKFDGYWKYRGKFEGLCICNTKSVESVFLNEQSAKFMGDMEPQENEILILYFMPCDLKDLYVVLQYCVVTQRTVYLFSANLNSGTVYLVMSKVVELYDPKNVMDSLFSRSYEDGSYEVGIGSFSKLNFV